MRKHKSRIHAAKMRPNVRTMVKSRGVV